MTSAPARAAACGLRDVLVDVAGGHDQVDPRLLRRVTPAPHQSSRRVDGRPRDGSRRATAGGPPIARVGVRPVGQLEPDLTVAALSASSSRSPAAPLASACQTGSATPCSMPTSRADGVEQPVDPRRGRRRRPPADRPAAAPPARPTRSCAVGRGRRSARPARLPVGGPCGPSPGPDPAAGGHAGVLLSEDHPPVDDRRRHARQWTPSGQLGQRRVPCRPRAARHVPAPRRWRRHRAQQCRPASSRAAR